MNDIKQYLKLKNALRNEQAKIEARLAEIAKVLNGDGGATVAAVATRGGRRTFSAATKAKMAAAQKARWSKKKGVVAVKAVVDAAPAPKQSKRTMSEATKAKMRAAHQARWALSKGTAVITKAFAVPASTSAPAPKKKRKMSAAGKANIIAAVKSKANK